MSTLLAVALIPAILFHPKPEVHRIVTTGYCLGPCRICGTHGRTASGLTRGTLASRGGRSLGIMANNRYPFGSIVKIGKREYVILDRGTSGYHFDILCATHRIAKLYGKRWEKAVIYPATNHRAKTYTKQAHRRHNRRLSPRTSVGSIKRGTNRIGTQGHF